MTHVPAVAVAEAPPAGPVHDPIDWALAERVARRFAGHEPLAASYLAGSLRADFDAVTTEAEALVADYTGLRAPGPARAQVVDRSSWVGANVSSMRQLLAPLTARVGERMASSRVAPIGRRVAGTETGVLLGYLAQRVLGQYDLLVLDDDASADAVYYVGGNILALEKRFAFRPRDFRLWIAIHEVTHRAQFTGVPWMKSLLPVVGGEHAASPSIPIPSVSCRRWRAPPTNSATVETPSTTAGSSPSSRATSSAARWPTCRP